MTAACGPSRRSDWRGDLSARVRSRWVTKMLGTTLGIGGFFVAYFWVLHHPFSAVAVMPLTAVDRLIGFRPQALPLYLSLWFYVSLAPALLRTRRELASYALAALGAGLAGLAIFIVWPTRVPSFEVDALLHPGLALLHGVDVANNACPSLHVAFALLTSVGIARSLREMGTGYPLRALNALWCLGIVYSTLAIRQHVVLDVIGGAVLGALAAALYLGSLRRGLPRRRRGVDLIGG